MDLQFWLDLGWLFLVNLVTPTLFFLSPLRVAQMTVYSLQCHWLIVTVVCTVGGVIGMVPSYVLADRLAVTGYGRRFLAKPAAAKLRQRLGGRMFALVLLGNLVLVPDVVPNIIAGLARYPWRRYLLASVIGRFLHVLPWTLAGASAGRFPVVVSTYRQSRAALGSWISAVLHWVMTDLWRAGFIAGGMLMVLVFGLARYARRLSTQTSHLDPEREIPHRP